MKPAAQQRNVLLSGGLRTGQFGISRKAQVHILRILRDTLYTNKVLAVEREYATNAWDAHRAVGKEDLPIKVTLPTELESSFIIRDWGPGLSQDDVFDVFIQYGESTKRETDDEAGMFGIGGKSAFAYNDSFTITSYHGGTRRVYHAVLDETDQGELILLHESALGEHLRGFLETVDPGADYSSLVDGKFCDLHPWLDEPYTKDFAELVPLIAATRMEQFEAWLGEHAEGTETGVEIKVPVNPGDISAFHREAQSLFRYFRPLPEINIPLEEPAAKWRTEHGWLSPRVGYHSNSWTAVMGCVPYRLNLGALEGELREEGLDRAIGGLTGGLYFDIGGVDIVASREELEYKPRTKKAIVEGFANLLKAVTEELEGILGDPDLNDFERRLKVREFVARTHIPLSGDNKKWGGGAQGAPLYSTGFLMKEGEPVKDKDGNNVSQAPKSFVLQAWDQGWADGKKRVVLKENARVPLEAEARLLVRDTLQPWRGYATKPHDRIVSIKKGHDVAQVMAELGECVKAAGLEGLEIIRMSQMEYIPYNKRGSGASYNQKHSERVFVLKSRGLRGRGVLSENWEIADHTPDQDDVYVILNRFAPVEGWGHTNFFWCVTADRGIFKNLFGEAMPPIIGYKSTQSKPVKAQDLEGTPYLEWRKTIFAEALGQRPAIQRLVDAHSWTIADPGTYSVHWANRKGIRVLSEEETEKWLRQNIDNRHRLVQFYAKRVAAASILRKNALNRDSHTKALERLSRLVRPKRTVGENMLLRIYEKYPLLKQDSQNNTTGLAVLSGPLRDHWLRYVKLIDNSLRK